MSFIGMAKELLGDIPGIPLPYAQTLLNQALLRIYDEQRWSFQVSEAGWLTPGLLGGFTTQFGSPGTITVTPYSTSIVGNAVATAAWLAYVGFLTQQPIRVPGFSLYNIIAYDNGQDPANSPNYPFATLTLDRPWMGPQQINSGYMIYPAYFPTGSTTFRKFGAIRDTTNNAWVNFWQRDQQWLAANDPQRTIFDLPTYAVPYEVDQRVGSSTFGQMLYELWPHPLSRLPYTYSFLQRGPALVLPSDTVPYPLNEELVLWRGKEIGYMWKESQKDDGMERGSGADWRFLAQEARGEYVLGLKLAKLLDSNLGDLYWTKFRQTAVAQDGYETMIGTLNVGTF